MRIPATQLTAYLERLYRAEGMSRSAARVMATTHVEADLRGIPGHGSRLAPSYLAKLRAGVLNARPRVTVCRKGVASRVLDADFAPGPIAAAHAVAACVGHVRSSGIALVTVRRAGHAGAVGIPASHLAGRGLIGLVAVPTSSASVALIGGNGSATLGNSAVAIAVPGPDARQPVIVDLAAGATSWGRLHEHARQGRELPEGWALDHAREPTQDPDKASVLLPEGVRGQAVAIVVQLLLGALTGDGALPDGQEERGLVCLAVDPRHFATADLAEAAGEIAAAVRGQGARMPGDRAWTHRAAALRLGIELDDADLTALIAAGHPHVRAPRSWLRSPHPSPPDEEESS